ncbi:MAG: hypothetical protein WCK72_00865 [Actinomycetes bacterium]
MNLIDDLNEIFLSPPRCGTTRVIAIDGRAGAGKTTLAHELFLAFSTQMHVSVLGMDEIYHGWDDALGNSLKHTLSSLLEDLGQNSASQVPIYNWSSACLDSARIINPCDLLILEGVGSAQQIVREFTLATIWLDIDPSIGLQRVIDRDGELISSQMQRWQQEEVRHFSHDKTRENADFVLSTM